MGRRGVLAGLGALALLAGCNALPDKPVRSTEYDFGPRAAGEVTGPPAGAQALVLADVEASGSLEGSQILYRLAYADAHQLKPYALARWSAPPAQLVRQRLREHLGRERIVLDPADAAALVRQGGRMPRRLRVELEEFSHLFTSTTQGEGVVRLRCTLLENAPGGERLLAQRVFAVQRAAPTPDASGGVRGMTAALDAAAQDLGAWLRTLG